MYRETGIALWLEKAEAALRPLHSWDQPGGSDEVRPARPAGHVARAITRSTTGSGGHKRRRSLPHAARGARAETVL